LPQLLNLQVENQLIALDPRGCGMSQAVGPYDISQQADDIATVITTKRVEPCVIVSHSMGGYAALLLNRRHPEFVLANVFIDVPLSETGSDTTRIVDALKQANSHTPLNPMVKSMGTLASQEVRDIIQAMMLTRPVEVALGMLSDLETVTNDMSALIAKVATKPCLTIFPGPKPAGADPVWLAHTFPSIEQKMIHGVGHFVQLEQPEAVNAMLIEFLNGIGT
jgi:pimeloyl-ACP methyl ester carboxylesterase